MPKSKGLCPVCPLATHTHTHNWVSYDSQVILGVALTCVCWEWWEVHLWTHGGTSLVTFLRSSDIRRPPPLVNPAMVGQILLIVPPDPKPSGDSLQPPWCYTQQLHSAELRDNNVKSISIIMHILKLIWPKHLGGTVMLNQHCANPVEHMTHGGVAVLLHHQFVRVQSSHSCSVIVKSL